MCRAIRPAVAPAPCPCSSLTRDTTAWCNTCWLQLCDLERDLTPDLPRDYTARDVLVAALLHLNIQANHPTA
jgi:hypothetical protein